MPVLKGTGLSLISAEHEDLKSCCGGYPKSGASIPPSGRKGPAAQSFLLMDPGLQCRMWPCSVLLHAALILSPLWGFYSSLPINVRWKVSNYCSNGSANSFVAYQSRAVRAEEEKR